MAYVRQKRGDKWVNLPVEVKTYLCDYHDKQFNDLAVWDNSLDFEVSFCGPWEKLKFK